MRIAGAGALAAFAIGAAAFDVQGHRGARGLAPENTLAGFERALRAGVDTLELDTALTKDGVVVVTHDLRLNPALVRGADGRWLTPPTPAIADLTLAELRRYDVGRLQPGTPYANAHPQQRPVDGARIPTLDDVLAATRASGVRYNVETKLSPLEPDASPDLEALVRALVAAIERHRVVDRTSIQSFDWRTLHVAQRLAPRIRRVALTQPDTVADRRWTAGLALASFGGSVPKLAHAAGAQVWSPRFDTIDARALAEAKALKLDVIVWTVNRPADIERMLDLGVDGIISDRPDRVRAALGARATAARR
jgi:glycerophosphoryl diester phosphodiesterase